jgi:hypothetical protein
MPNWNDPASIKKYLDDEKRRKTIEDTRAKAQRKDYAQKAVAQKAKPKATPTPSILKPLVTGRPVTATGPVTGRTDTNTDTNTDTGRRRQEPQQRVRERTFQDVDDRTRTGSSTWRQPASGMDAALRVVGGVFGMQPETITEQAARHNAQLEAKVNKDKGIDFNSWRKVSQQSAVPGLPSEAKDIYDLLGLQDLPAAKYADAQTERQLTDDTPEQFPGQDWLNNVGNQWQAAGRALTDTPLVPYTGQKNDRYGLEEGKQYNLTGADMLASGGEFLKRTTNTTIPGIPGIEPIFPDAGKWVADTLGFKTADNFQKEYDTAVKDAGAQIKARTAISNLPASNQDMAWRIATGTGQSLKTDEALAEWQTLPQQIEIARKNMEQAVASGDTKLAAELGQQYNKLKNTSEWDIIEKYQNPGAELMFGAFLDPLDLGWGAAAKLIGATPKFAKLAQAAKKMNVSPELASVNMDAAIKAA